LWPVTLNGMVTRLRYARVFERFHDRTIMRQQGISYMLSGTSINISDILNASDNRKAGIARGSFA
jgi:hypothetical protein